MNHADEEEHLMIGTLANVAFDTADNEGLAQFYADLLGMPLSANRDEWIEVTTPDGWLLGFQRAPDHQRPAWPGQSRPQQMHLDFRVADRDAMSAMAEDLGATTVGRGDGWTVLTDPSGHPFCLCDNRQSEPIGVFSITVDCADAWRLARFYGDLLGMHPAGAASEGGDRARIDGDGPNGSMVFHAVPGYTPPQWPDPNHPQQMHLDVTIEDVDAAEAAALRIGASRLPGSGDHWRVYADPAGHPFCLCW
jgi:catechol-2,3-dioxygenase